MNTTPFHITDKKILITGATSGIGEETVKSVIKMGGKVILTSRHIDKLKLLQKELGESVIQIIACDFAIESNIEKLAKDIVTIDGIVHCAGIVTPYPIRYLSFKKLDETIHLNFYSAATLIAQIDQKKKLNNGASLVFLSSISGVHPHKGGSTYGASKAALESFSKVVALEYAHRKIRSNVIAPGMVKTALYEKAAEDTGHDKMQEHIDKYPLGIGKPDDVANTCIYLLSDASRWMTGSTITIDGGVLLGY